MTHMRSLVSLALCGVLLATGFVVGRHVGKSDQRSGAALMEFTRQDFFRFAVSTLKGPGPGTFHFGPFRFTAEPARFSYFAPGDLTGRTGTGSARSGTADWTAFAPDMAFPVEASNPAFLNSQIYSPGGGGYRGAGPDNQCALANYSHPWRDNFCERRGGKDRESLNCPSRAIHQGVDIRGGTGGSRASTCARMAWDEGAPQNLVPVVAAEDGWIEYSLLPHKYVVNLITSKGRIYSYMHLDRASLVQAPGARVSRGETIGYLSDYFGRSRTTQHLHFEILQNIDGKGWSHVSPYMSLVRAYERDHGVTGVLVEDES